MTSGVTEEKRCDRLDLVIEAILFASGDPIPISRICDALTIERDEAEEAISSLRMYYEVENRGIRLIQMEDCYQLCSAPEYADAIRRALEMRKPQKLSRPSLEVLTIIAYYQPITRLRVEQIRGLDCTYIISLLVDLGLIEKCGQVDAVGHPSLYRTTANFLRYFRISSLRELPELPDRNAIGTNAPEQTSETESLVLPDGIVGLDE